MAERAARKLPATAVQAANAAIAAWQQAPERPAACPVCNAAALVVIDRSARPYTAWFALSCASCGLDDTVTYAMGGTGNSWS
jgi:transcription elongation factor Elf1